MRNCRIKHICCVDSIYSLFIYFLLNPDMKESTFFFVSKGVAKSVRDNLPFVKYVPSPQLNKIGVFFYHIYIYIYIMIYMKIRRIPKGLPTFGHDFLRWSDYFVHSTQEFYLLEDGVGNYLYPVKFSNKYKERRFYRFLVKTFPMFTLPFGLSSHVRRIYLTGIMEIPEIIRNKTEIANIDVLWNQLSELQKKDILYVYATDTKEIDDLLSTSRSVLLLTQCFSEDGVWSEDEKISNYKKLLQDYSMDDVIIKTHPREKTNYKKIFPNALVITSPIPFQLLNLLLDLKIKTAITYNSTAIFCLSDKVNKITVDINNVSPQ